MAIRTQFFGLAASLAALLVSSAASAQSPKRQAIVELFTSQGCSSCPPADVVFEQYAKRADVIALSFNVHYWDNLGWKDTLASPQFTYRQKAYARARGDGQVYTPQVIVNGTAHVVGSDQAAIEDALRKSSRSAATPWVPLKFVKSASGMVLEAEGQPGVSGDSAIWLATVARKVDVAVKRGENAGRNLTYFNVVRSFDSIGTYQGKPLSIRLDAKLLEQAEVDSIVAVVQSASAGPIVGATMLSMK